MHRPEDFTINDAPPPGYGFLYTLRLANGALYVGQTRKSVAWRLRGHKHRAEKTECNDKLYNARRVYGGPVEVRVADVVPLEVLNDAEIALIAELDTFRNGLNSTPGGEDSPTLIPEIADKISAAKKGVPLSEKNRAAISAAKKGVPLSEKNRAALSAAKKGVPLSEKNRAAISAALKGVPLSEEHRASLSAAKKGVPLSEEHRARNSAGQALKWAKRQGRPFSLIETRSLYVPEPQK